MSDRRILRASWIALVLLASAAAPAAAQPDKRNKDSADASSAKELYASAQKLFDKGKYSDALVAFRQAYNASSSPNARLMIGHCLVALGHTAEAYEEMAATMREAGKRAETESKYAPTRDSAATQVAILEAKVGKVIIEVPERSGVDVTLNGARVAPEKLGVPMAVDPGTAVVVATRSDGRSARREQSVKAGETERIALTFSDETKTATGPGPVSTSTPPGGESSSPPAGGAAKTGGGVRIAGFVVMGLGASGMALFGVTGSMARSKFATLEDECGGQRCTDPKYADVVDSGATLTTMANIGLIAGAAGIAAGGLMVIFGGPSEAPKADKGAALSVSPLPGGARLHYTVTF